MFITPREILNELKWRHDRDLKHAKIVYIHRGGGTNTRTVSGDSIIALHKQFMEIENGTMIPYHRIIRIFYRDEIIFEKGKRKNR